LKNDVCKGTDANMLLDPLWYKIIVGLKYPKSFFQIPNPHAQREKIHFPPYFPSMAIRFTNQKHVFNHRIIEW